MLFHIKGNETKVIKKAKKNFHILTPTKNIIKIPKNNTDREVPRSG